MFNAFSHNLKFVNDITYYIMQHYTPLMIPSWRIQHKRKFNLVLQEIKTKGEAVRNCLRS
jgi:hypothetical protein